MLTCILRRWFFCLTWHSRAPLIVVLRSSYHYDKYFILKFIAVYLSSGSLYRASAAWCITPDLCTISKSYFINRSCKRANFPFRRQDSESTAIHSNPFQRWIGIRAGRGVIVGLPIGQRNIRNVSYRGSCLFLSVSKTNSHWASRYHRLVFAIVRSLSVYQSRQYAKHTVRCSSEVSVLVKKWAFPWVPPRHLLSPR